MILGVLKNLGYENCVGRLSIPSVTPGGQTRSPSQSLSPIPFWALWILMIWTLANQQQNKSSQMWEHRLGNPETGILSTHNFTWSYRNQDPSLQILLFLFKPSQSFLNNRNAIQTFHRLGGNACLNTLNPLSLGLWVSCPKWKTRWFGLICLELNHKLKYEQILVVLSGASCSKV